MRVSEWMSEHPEFFSELVQRSENEAFKDIEPDKLKVTFRYLYGDRDITKSIKDMTIQEIVDVIILIYNDGWKQSYQLLHDEVMNGVSSQHTTVDTGTSKNNRDMQRSNLDNVSAFNDDDYSPDSENDESIIDETKSENDSTKEQTTKSLWAVQQQLYLARNSFMKDYIIKNVAEVITSDIY